MKRKISKCILLFFIVVIAQLFKPVLFDELFKWVATMQKQ